MFLAYADVVYLTTLHVVQTDNVECYYDNELQNRFEDLGMGGGIILQWM